MSWIFFLSRSRSAGFVYLPALDLLEELLGDFFAGVRRGELRRALFLAAMEVQVDPPRHGGKPTRAPGRGHVNTQPALNSAHTGA